MPEQSLGIDTLCSGQNYYKPFTRRGIIPPIRPHGLLDEAVNHGYVVPEWPLVE